MKSRTATANPPPRSAIAHSPLPIAQPLTTKAPLMTKTKTSKTRTGDPAPAPVKPYVPEDFFESALFQRFLNLIPEYALFELAPRLLAEAARRKGAADASPRDYDCRCPIEIADSLPRCAAPDSGCRFADRALAADDLEKFKNGGDARMVEGKRAMPAEIDAFLKANDAARRKMIARMAAAAGQRRRRPRWCLTGGR